MNRLIFTLFFMTIGLCNLTAQDDSTILDFDIYYQLVIENHPMAKQANIISELGKQQVRLARGGFDPKLGLSWSKKNFKETEYYDIISASLKVPAWFGITPEVGIDRNEGAFLNPENFISNVTNNQQYYAGITLSAGQGLFIDARRASLQQAKLFQKMAEAEQISTLNKLLLAAAKTYWEWYFAYNQYLVLQQSINLVDDINNRTVLGFEQGEQSVLDTIQSNTSLLTRKVELAESKIALQNASLSMSVFMWNENGLPLELRNGTRPELASITEFTAGDLEALLNLATENHPELVKLRLKSESLTIDNRMAKESLKPRLDFKYFLLDQPLTPNGDNADLTFSDNYKLGLDFSFPLFLRKERGRLKETELRLLDNQFSLQYQERVIVNDITSQYFDLVNSAEIIRNLSGIVDNYQRIVAAEGLNLANGESDIFKINIQTDKMLETQSKFIKMNAEYQKKLAELLWLAGVVNLDYAAE